LHLEERLMDEVGVIAVHPVLHLELPVAVVTVLVHPATRVDRALGRKIHEEIDVIFRAGQVIRQRLDVGAKAGENQPAILLDARRFDQRKLAAIEIAPVAASIRHSYQVAFVVVGPAVVPAAKVARIAALLLTDCRRPMHTAVHQDMDLAVLVAGQNCRLGADADRLVVARLGDLALMTDEHPVAFEDAFHLELEDAGLEIDSAVHPRVLNQIFEIRFSRHDVLSLLLDTTPAAAGATRFRFRSRSFIRAWTVSIYGTSIR
jgi:hypothetical protein